MLTFFTILIWLAGTNAHISAFHEGMYCLNGNVKGAIDLNANAMVAPLYQLPLEEWWFHHINKCDEFPPAENATLLLPAGGTFTVELADNQAKSSLSYGGQYTSQWPDGSTHPELSESQLLDEGICVTSPNLHAQNSSRAAGTSFAISYESDITKVTQENLVVFSVAYHTPWKRITTYEVPADMPPCPADGCICSWNWIPNGCGTANMYMQGYKCKVTNSKSNTPLAKPKPAVWCEGNSTACIKGAKQVIGWHQQSGNNIEVTGFDLAGDHKSPGYNMNCGFANGAQNDIFATPSKRDLVDEDDSSNTSETGAAFADISSHRRNSLLRHADRKNRIRHW
jgi:hypothetical protein